MALPPTVVSLSVSPTSALLPAGQTIQLTATAGLSDGTSIDVTGTARWTSSNPVVASVSIIGLAQALAPGLATISAAFSGLTVSAVIEVMRSTVRSGNWSDPAIWDLGSVPVAGESVHVGPTHTVVYDLLSDAVMGDILVMGTLRMSRAVSTRLRTDGNIVVEMGGNLDMGTSLDPIPASVLCEVYWELTLAQAGAYVGGAEFNASDKGIWAMAGSSWNTHGAPLRRAWSKLMGTAPAGSSSVIVEHDVRDWYIGGEVLVTMTNTPTDRVDGPWQNEVRTISAITPLADGTAQLTLTPPLSFTHEALPLMRGEVGLLSRNVRFQTHLIGRTEAEHISPKSNRQFAHTMWMAGSTGDMAYSELKFMGHHPPTAPGRYPIHAHLNGDGSRGKRIVGNGIWYAGSTWVNLHLSNGVVVEDNVGFSCVGNGYLVEGAEALEIFPLDLAFVHNLGVEAMGETGIGGRMGVYWPVNSEGTAHLGNVGVAIREGGDKTGAFIYGEFAPKETHAGLVIPGNFFLGNEAHSNGHAGYWSWTNASPVLDIVNLSCWRNGSSGFEVGAYSGRQHFFNCLSLENGGPAQMISTITRTWVQDSLLVGKPGLTDYGYHIQAYFNPQEVGEPHYHVRNTYRNLARGFGHVHDPCPDPVWERDPLGNLEGDCSADYTLFMGPRFEQVTVPDDFGWHSNANSWHHVSDPVGMDPALGSNFYVCRRDQLNPLAQGPLTAVIINPSSFYYTGFDGVITPTPLWANYPPTISIGVTMRGKIADIVVSASDDRDIPEVEIWVDWTRLATQLAPPYGTSVDLSNYPRKYAYIWAKSMDRTSNYDDMDPVTGRYGPYRQRAFSNIVEVGPELLLATPPPPPPPPPPGRMRGDATGDGVVNLTDVLRIIDWLLGTLPPPPVGSEDFIGGDTNGDGLLTLGDVLRIIDFLLGVIASL